MNRHHYRAIRSDVESSIGTSFVMVAWETTGTFQEDPPSGPMCIKLHSLTVHCGDPGTATEATFSITEDTGGNKSLVNVDVDCTETLSDVPSASGEKVAVFAFNSTVIAFDSGLYVWLKFDATVDDVYCTLCWED